MDTALEPGRGIGRSIAAGEGAERELDRFISYRHDKHVASEGERAVEEAWKASEGREQARRREENRAAWCGYFSHLAGSLRARAEEYDQRAQTLMEEH